MTRVTGIVATLVLLVASAAGSAHAGSPNRASYGDYVRAARALLEWRYAEAAALLAEIDKHSADTPEAMYLDAELAFVRGDYPRAKALLAKLGDHAPHGLGEDLAPLITTTIAATAGMTSRVSPGGHFIFFYQPGKDELLIDLAGEALDTAWERIGTDLGYKPKELVRVEFFPRASDLARVSTLSEKAIETTGTIALCKYGKLMAVSPRGTLLGYAWIDTLVHEYTHYVVSSATGDRVPVWLQEGLAKYEETRWRTEPGQAGIDKVGAHLLAHALKKGRLVTFEEMHPSMALLPTADLAATAYAEVYTFVAWMHDTVGYLGIQGVLTRMREDRSERRAIAEVMGDRWEKVEGAWRKHLKTLPLKTSAQAAARAGKAAVKVRKGKDASDDDDSADLDEVTDERARKFVRLGGMLRVRRQLAAAAVEYEKALAIVGPGGDAVVASKLGRTYLALEQPEKAIATLAAVPELDDNDAGPHTTLGLAYLQTGQLDLAEHELVLAVRIQPFDPAVRCGLADVYGKTGKPDLATRETSACVIAKGEAQ